MVAITAQAEEAMSEAHVPTEYSPSGEEPRVSSPHVDSRRPGDHLGSAAEGPHASQRLASQVWRLRGRSNIEAARRARRSASGPVWVRWAPEDAAAPPAVGYAIGKHVGPAVIRNRIRRRLRASVASVAPELAPGRYLVGASAGAARLPFLDLTAAVRAALTASGAVAAGPAT
jgi:ribonuclease P protein component